MRILLAEDERDLSRALVALFQKNKYSVDVAHDGEQALKLFETGSYDCAVLDIMMPKVDGLTVLKTIRSRGDKIPVIILTAKTEMDDMIEGLDSGADDYLTKPFSVKELLARIRAITRRVTDSGNSILTFEGLSLNRANYILSTQDGEIRLTGKEYQMMEMLLSGVGKVVSTTTFMEKIWGFDSETDMSVVWVYVSYLRSKLKKLKAKVEIKAMRNEGYSLEKI